jgi:hypothetical protein
LLWSSVGQSHWRALAERKLGLTWVCKGALQLLHEEQQRQGSQILMCTCVLVPWNLLKMRILAWQDGGRVWDSELFCFVLFLR